MEKKLIIAGFGGQGVIITGEIIAHTGMLVKKKVTLVPSYGPEIRGGTANCTVILKDGEIYSPVVTYPDILIALNQPSLDRFEKQVLPQGFILFNSSLCPRKKSRKDITYFGIPATEIASELGDVRVANVVMLGALIAQTRLIPASILSNKVLPAVFKDKSNSVLKLNQQALDKGLEYQKEGC
jgi:2-oxoglutarate ferredoxin oxidoreductase subunit gamma